MALFHNYQNWTLIVSGGDIATEDERKCMKGRCVEERNAVI